MRCAASSAPHDGAGHRRRDSDGGVADRRGIEVQAGRRGAWTAGGQAALLRCRLAGASGGSRAVAGAERLSPPGALERADSGTGVAPALGRPHPGLPGDGGRVMSDEIRLSVTTVNAPDALALARFYAELTGGVTKGSTHWATVAGPNGFIAFQQIDDFRPPVWPGADVPMQMHLDFYVDDLEATGARAVAAGATGLDFQPNSDHCFVYADPAGHPFCLSTWDGPHPADHPFCLSTWDGARLDG